MMRCWLANLSRFWLMDFGPRLFVLPLTWAKAVVLFVMVLSMAWVKSDGGRL